MCRALEVLEALQQAGERASCNMSLALAEVLTANCAKLASVTHHVTKIKGPLREQISLHGRLPLAARAKDGAADRPSLAPLSTMLFSFPAALASWISRVALIRACSSYIQLKWKARRWGFVDKVGSGANSAIVRHQAVVFPCLWADLLQVRILARDALY